MTEPEVIVTGNAANGFVVEMHDGDRFLSVAVKAADENAAKAEGLKRFYDTAPVVESPSATMAHVEAAVSELWQRFEARLKELTAPPVVSKGTPAP